MADVHMNTDDHDAELHPIALLMDELKHTDISIRCHAIQKLDTIAIALGPERTRAELMAFLSGTRRLIRICHGRGR